VGEHCRGCLLSYVRVTADKRNIAECDKGLAGFLFHDQLFSFFCLEAVNHELKHSVVKVLDLFFFLVFRFADYFMCEILYEYSPMRRDDVVSLIFSENQETEEVSKSISSHASSFGGVGSHLVNGFSRNILQVERSVEPGLECRAVVSDIK